MRRFYCPTELVKGTVVELPPAEGRHLTTVLRAGVGEKITLLNGFGVRAVAEIVEISGRKQNTSVKVQVVEVDLIEKASLQIALYVACPRSVPIEMVLKQAVELGVAEIHPIVTEFTVAKPKDKTDKWQAALIEACKQSGNPYLPKLFSPVKFKEAVKNAPQNGVVGAVPLDETDVNASEMPKSGQVAVWIGPEGGFSVSELEILFGEKKYYPLTVGPNILRLETAVVAVISVLMSS